jgi:DNA-binding NarL/FixJ family response regulator
VPNDAAQSILIADDHPLFRQAMVMAVGRVRPDVAVVEAGTLAAAESAAAAQEDLALILLDLKMPGAIGYSGVALLHAARPSVPILVVSAAEAVAGARNARSFGAVGFISKESPLAEIEAAIAATLAGQRLAEDDAPIDEDGVAERLASLSPMQLKVLLGVIDGRLNKQIAYDLGITEATVKAHMTALMKKLDVGNRTQAAIVARALGIAIDH